MEAIDVRGSKIGILPLNSALFCQDNEDHAQLWIGRRCLASALKELEQKGADLKVALLHHPLDWLNDLEVANIAAELEANVDFVLRGHLHRTDVQYIAGVGGEALHLAAGAAYQTRQWPNRAIYVTIDGSQVTVFPIKYEDEPRETWTVDPSLFPQEPGYQKEYAIARLARRAPPPPQPHPAKPPERAPLPAFRSNIPSRRNLPFVGREELLDQISEKLDDPGRESVLVLHGPPGVGKSELAREFARRQRERYPGGRFFIDAGTGSAPMDLARIGETILELDFPDDVPLQDQCLRALLALANAPSLLIYDNVRSPEAIVPWLPPAGMPCHVLITTLVERWDAGWLTLPVKPLSAAASLELIEGLTDHEVADRYGKRLADLAGGLPVQLVPASATLAYEKLRGRLDTAALTLTREASESFLGVYTQLERPIQLLLHAAAFLNAQRIPRGELKRQIVEAGDWSEAEFDRRLDACFDLHLLEGGAELRMHQLFASFLLATPVPAEIAATLDKVRQVQARRVVELATELATNPNQAELAVALMAFPLDPRRWEDVGAGISIENGETVGRALYEIGQFDAARPWYERAVPAKEKGDADGRVDYESLGKTLHLAGICLSSTGQFEAARPWYERAVAAAEKGDIHGRVDHDSLGRSLAQVGFCLSETGQFEAARPWYERAVAAAEKGNVDGRVDYDNVGRSLHQVGLCLSSTGQFEAAWPWYERAVAAAEKGDIFGRVDHTQLGNSLHQVGVCLSSTGQFETARSWYERAVEAAEKGDVYGRVNHDWVGRSLHLVGVCLSETSQFEAARPWYERAVAAAEKGDLHGRVDHAQLGKSLHQVGICLSSTGQFEAARPWYERAVAAAEKGDTHGRVDHDGLGRSLHQVGICLSSTGQFEAARPWYKRAVAAKEKGDIFGRVDNASLRTSLNAVAYCFRQLGRSEDAKAWEERASRLEPQ